MPDQYQVIQITFTDGTQATYVGRAVVDPETKLGITDILFTKGKDLPPDCHFEQLSSSERIPDGKQETTITTTSTTKKKKLKRRDRAQEPKA